ncbi:endoglucanase [Amycolatopsis decaplanina DSM 44594]|uniref:Endoglucanase n=1 Tax=Amycolatopsis decaplanina DSM 44594 TaxID=1284240 RepID=M2WUK8_9PSEU|nr:endoglucanase [Amycolatopsis decaplanina DSM 44594]
MGWCCGRQSALVVLLALASACGPAGHAIDPSAVAAPFPLLGSASDFYVDEYNPAAAWVRSPPAGPETDVIRDQIASRPAAQVIRAAEQVKQTVRQAGGTNTMPIFMVDPEQAEACETGRT